MLLDLKALTADIEQGQTRLINKLDQIVELLEAILVAGQTSNGHSNVSDGRRPALGGSA